MPANKAIANTSLRMRNLLNDRHIPCSYPFERGGYIDPQFSRQTEQLRIDGDVGAGFTATSVYSVPHTHELGTRSINVK
jgi:hypothetical protein